MQAHMPAVVRDDAAPAVPGRLLDSARGSPLEVGARAGDYLITEMLAHGGGGSVYGAYHATTRRTAAVKVLHRSLSQLPKAVERFQREVQVLNLLRHPGIVEVWDVGELPDGRPFFAMERLQGKTVSALLEEGGRLLPDEAIEIFEPVCGALAAAHSAGIVHRDVKTNNIMILEGSPRQVKLLDFGVAKLLAPSFGPSSLTTEGHAIGTPTSMAPEQILGSQVDIRTDVYALGVLLYRMLTGRPPFLARGALAQMRQHLEEPPPRPSLRAPAAAPLDPVVLRCLEKDPDRRYRCVEDLLSGLRAAVNGKSLHLDGGPSVCDLGAAVYVEIRMLSSPDHLTLETADLTGRILDASEDELRDAGMLIGLATGNQVLGILPLPIEPSSEIARVIDLALRVKSRLDEHDCASDAVQVSISVHIDEVVLGTSSSLEVLGGPLLHPELWAAKQDSPSVCLTEALARRLGKVLPTLDPRLTVLPPIDPERTLHAGAIRPQTDPRGRAP